MPENKPLLFNKWDLTEVKVSDPGLVKYINLAPIFVPRTDGRYGSVVIHKYKMCIIERLINRLMVPGHKGKKHKMTSGKCTGNKHTIYISLKKAFELIEKKTKMNPVQVLVKAIENSAMVEEIAAYRLGGIIARKAVTVSPQRRVDLALRYLTQGIYRATFNKPKGVINVIADELIAAANNDTKSFAISERMRTEKEADGAR